MFELTCGVCFAVFCDRCKIIDLTFFQIIGHRDDSDAGIMHQPILYEKAGLIVQ